MSRTERQIIPSAVADDVDFGAVRAFMRFVRVTFRTGTGVGS